MTIVVRDAVAADLRGDARHLRRLIESTTIAWTERRQTLDEQRAWFDEQGFEFGRRLDLVLRQRILGPPSADA